MMKLGLYIEYCSLLTWSLSRAIKRNQPIRILDEEQSTKGKDLAWIPEDHLDNYLSRSDTTQCDPGRGWTMCRRIGLKDDLG